MTCEQCGREIRRPREYDGGRRTRFCSRDCYGAWMVADRGDLATRVLESCERGANGDCWPWVGRWHGRYGQLQYAGERWLAHRAAYHTLVGDIPAGHVVMHRCDNGACVNPRHLEVGTQADNVRDMILKGRARWQDADTDWLIEAAASDRGRYAEPWPGAINAT